MKVINRKSIQIDAKGGDMIVGGGLAESVLDGVQVGSFHIYHSEYGNTLDLDKPLSKSDADCYKATADYLEIIFHRKRTVDIIIEVLTALSAAMDETKEES